MIKIYNKNVGYVHFPDGTVKLELPVNQGENTIVWLYENDAELVYLQFLVKHIRSKSPNSKLFLDMPYIPNARMDRVKSPEEVFTLKWFAEIINDLKFDNVFVQDAHSNVSLALINNVVESQPVRENLNLLKTYTNFDILFYPDEGAAKKYADILGTEYGFGIKHRDWKTGAITNYEVVANDVSGKNVLIVDDICSKGGTFLHAGNALKKLGAASVYLWVTHCENSIYDGELLKENSPIEKIYTTGDILNCSQTNEKIVVLGF